MLIVEIAAGIVLAWLVLRLVVEHTEIVAHVVVALVALIILGFLGLHWYSNPEDLRNAALTSAYLAVFVSPFFGIRWLYRRWRLRNKN